MQVSELAANPHVEVCWYFPTSREQFRLSGTAHIVALDHPDQQLLAARQQTWAAMSDAGVSVHCAQQSGGVGRQTMGDDNAAEPLLLLLFLLLMLVP